MEVSAIFRKADLSCLPRGASEDGIEPHEIQTTKRGIEISGKIWFLPNSLYSLKLCLARPNFSSIEGVTVAKLREATITGSRLEGETLSITIGV